MATIYMLQPVSAAHADSQDALVCSRYLSYYEDKYNLPQKILTALGRQESGKWDYTLKKHIPWPWAMNVGGKGYYFSSKTEALVNIRKIKRRNVESYDVGCMQINMKYHGHAFQDITQALNPQDNVAYAAKLLRQLYDKKGSWRGAIAAYHAGPQGLKSRRGREYARSIIKKWRIAMQEPDIMSHTAPIAIFKPLHVAEQLKAYQLASQSRMVKVTLVD